MADSKLTGLNALTGANLATTDVFEVTDISDTTMDASGTSKKITGAELAAGVAALGPYPALGDTQFLAQTLDPRYNSTGSATVAVTGRQRFVRIRVGAACTITNVCFGVRTAGVTFSNENSLGLFDASGTLLTKTADLATTINSTGFKTVAFAAPQAATAGQAFYIGWLAWASTLPAFNGPVVDTLGNIVASLGTSSTRPAYSATSTSTTMPTSFTPGSAIADNTLIWFGLT